MGRKYFMLCWNPNSLGDIFSEKKVESEIRKCDQYAGMIGSSSESATCDPFKPDGTMTVFDGNRSSRITKGVDSHKLGRWSYVTIQSRSYTCLKIITAYRCCIGQTSKNNIDKETAIKELMDHEETRDIFRMIRYWP